MKMSIGKKVDSFPPFSLGKQNKKEEEKKDLENNIQQIHIKHLAMLRHIPHPTHILHSSCLFKQIKINFIYYENKNKNKSQICKLAPH